MIACCNLAQVKFRHEDGTLDREAYRNAVRQLAAERSRFFLLHEDTACNCECHNKGADVLC